MSETVTSVFDGRAGGGKFGPGNAFSKGNANNKRMQELRKVMLESVPPDAIRGIILKMAILAAGGDVQAAKLVLEHTVGKPVQALELAGPDGDGRGFDMPRLLVVLMAALADHPGARVQVAEALRGLDREPDRPGDGA